jgi:pimeloyl-ACP methyl ester carboxylesterase
MIASLKNIDVYYEIKGEGRPIIMLHGYWPDHRVVSGPMEPVMVDREGWQRIYFDLPGMGKTPAKEWIKSSDDMLDVVCEFIDHVIPGKPFVLGGYSYGGYLARGVIARKPDLVDGLFLICPMMVDVGKRDLPPKNIIVKDPELMAKLTHEEKEGFESWVTVQSQRVWERAQSDVNESVKLADEDFLNHLQETAYEFSFDVDAAIGRFEKPTLILAGRQDWIVGYRDVWEVLESYPRATFAILDRAGHALQIEQEEVFNVQVNEWIDRVEEG